MQDTLPPPYKLIGIAKLAAESEVLEVKKRVEYLEIETRQFIGRSSNPRMPFVWTINPYRGCEFGCQYCYARYAHEFMELRDPLLFERKIFAKQFDRSRFRAELRKIKPGQPVWIGTATDPYQPAERRYGVTRAILEAFEPEHGFHIGITTKSDFVRRDAELLGRLAQRNAIQVNMTITTMDEALARSLEPMAPRPALRLEAVRALADRGVNVAVLAHPVMPLINDSDHSLRAVAAAAKACGATSFSAAPLFLKPCSAQVFLPFLEREFPHLVKRYRDRYAANAYLSGFYPDLIAERTARICEDLELEGRSAKYRPEYFEQEPQLSLFPS